MRNSNKHTPNGEVKNHKKRYAYLKDMDAARLQALLQQESFLSDEDDFDDELIRRITEILDERDPVFEQFDVQASLKTFRNEMVPDIEQDKKQTGTEKTFAVLPARPRRTRRAFRALLVAAVFVALLSGTLIASAFGYDFWGTVINWGKETFQIGAAAVVTDPTDAPAAAGSEDDVSMAEIVSYPSVEEAAETFDAPLLLPNWIPDGFELVQADVSGGKNGKMLAAVYQSGEASLLFTVMAYDSNTTYFFEKNDGNGETVVIRGIEHYFMKNMDRNSAVWLSGGYVYNISGDIFIDDLEKMVNSIYEGET